MAAVGFLATQALGHQAARDGWISSLVEYVRLHHRDLPDGRVIPRLKREAADIAQRVDWILANPDADRYERTMAQALIARRTWHTNFVLGRPLPQEKGDAA